MIENIVMKPLSENERLALSEAFPEEFRVVAGDDGYLWRYDRNEWTKGEQGAPGIQGPAGPQGEQGPPAPTDHTHNAGDINAGTFALALIPTGTGATQVALGNHTHTPAQAGATPAGTTLRYVGEWTSGIAVHPNDVVMHGGNLFRARIASSGTTAPNASSATADSRWEWLTFGSADGVRIGETATNLNTIINVGNYFAQHNVDAERCTNRPAGMNVAFTLEVLRWGRDGANESRRVQRLTSHAFGSTPERVFTRTGSGATVATWTAWAEQSASDAAFAASAGTATALTASIPGWTETAGRIVRIRPHVAVGANATLNINGIGARQIRTQMNQQIAANMVAASTVITLVWFNNSFFLQGVSSAPNLTPVTRTITTLTASTTWTVPAGVTSIHVTLIGGGAGGYGGQGSPTTNNRVAISGSGGSSGGFNQFVQAVTPGQSIAVVIGSGGVGSNGTGAGIAGAHGPLPTGGGNSSITLGGIQTTATGGQRATTATTNLFSQTAFRNFSGAAGSPNGRRGGQSGYAWRRVSTPGPNSNVMAGGIHGIGGDGGSVHPQFGGGGGGGNASSTETFFTDISNRGSALAGDGNAATANGNGGRGGNGAPGAVIIVW